MDKLRPRTIPHDALDLRPVPLGCLPIRSLQPRACELPQLQMPYRGPARCAPTRPGHLLFSLRATGGPTHALA